MARVMLLFFQYLTYALYVSEGIKLMLFLLSTFPWVVSLVLLSWILLVSQFPLGRSETFLCFLLVRSSKIDPLPGVPLREILICSDSDVFSKQSVNLMQTTYF